VSERRLTEAEWAAQYRAEYEVPDKSYRRFPLGEDVGRYLRAKRVEGAKPNTIVTYEHALRLFVLDHRDLSLADFGGVGGTDLLYDFLAKWWGDASAATMRVRAAAVKSFFNWAEDTDRIEKNPARRLKAPKLSRRAARRAHELAQIKQIVAAQDCIADEVFLLVMGRLALRKMEAACVRPRDVDLKHDLIYLPDSKSGETAEVPIVFQDVRLALDLWLREDRHPDEYLLAPRGHPRRKPNPATVHRRFKRCLAKAGIEDFPMHELRHSAGDHLHRVTGDVKAAQELFRHASLSTTEEYLHPTHEDLRARMRQAEGEN
jgi:integrase/recombinase XerC